MIDATSKALFHSLAQVEHAASGSPRATACARAASPAASSPARPSRKRSSAVARSARRGPAADARLPRRERRELRRGRRRGRASTSRIIDAIVAVGHRAQHLAEADAARPRRRPRDRRRQHAAHPRAGRRERLLRAHRHGELAVHRRDARDPRDAVAAGASQRRHGHPVVPEPIAAATSRRLNALGARVRLVKGAYKEPQDRRVPGQVARWTRHSSS